ncbi:hypothetical protein [Fodinibius sp.]|uniref:hypothetical protein n=1 Tax=Fodinibius sp. TaxID=1872440 RepID=UPI002ACE28C8|nr:hypothetical protein [Fodinibius sp.]MDZ7660051.1 hypothetical protein [Fodinibius sp.]
MDCKKRADFLDSFHQQLRVYVKKNKPRKSVDYNKLTHHLKLVAERAKRKNWKTSNYLKRITEIIAYTTSGKQNEIDLNPNQEHMFDFSPIDLEEHPNRKTSIDYTPRKWSDESE